MKKSELIPDKKPPPEPAPHAMVHRPGRHARPITQPTYVTPNPPPRPQSPPAEIPASPPAPGPGPAYLKRPHLGWGFK